jgi:hypothetical protein
LWVAHLVVSMGAMLWSFTLSSSHFEGHHVSATLSLLVRAVVAVTWFPLNLVPLSAAQAPGLWGWVPVVVNSGVWAAGLCWVWRWARRR